MTLPTLGCRLISDNADGWYRPITVFGMGYHYGDNRLLHWRFEGSNDGATWTVLRTHTDGTSPFPDHAYSVAAWPVDPPAAAAGAAGAAGPPGFQHFRIIQTGTNSSGSNLLMCAGIELYGLFTEA